ncbi:MAG: EamA family transporter RarD [Phycisphaerales bacterium]
MPYTGAARSGRAGRIDLECGSMSPPSPSIPPPPTKIRPAPMQYPHKGKGIAFAGCAFGWWAVVVPSFFKLLSAHGASPLEILAQRVLFGLPVLLLMLMFSRQLGVFLRAASAWTSLRVLIPSTALIGINWYFFIYAVSTERLSHASLGYYINPLVSIALGFLFLGERPRPVQWGAIALAACAVVVMGYAELSAEDSLGLPWISLVLPASFGLYGLLRKQANVGPSVGLTFEMLLLLPLCAGLVIWLNNTGGAIFMAPGTEVWITGIMLLGGVVTIVPLICFTNAVRLLPLSTVGLLQYTAPTGQLLLSVLVFGEHFTPMKFAAFGIIWLAVGIYTWDMLRGHRQARAAVRAAARTEMLE